MECELCNDFEGSRKSLAAHICGRNDDTHNEHVGLDDNDDPLLRRDHRRQQRAEERKVMPSAGTDTNNNAADDDATADDTDSDSRTGTLLGIGAAGLLLRELVDDDNDRGSI